jgi:hypothetical protein
MLRRAVRANQIGDRLFLAISSDLLLLVPVGIELNPSLLQQDFRVMLGRVER